MTDAQSALDSAAEDADMAALQTALDEAQKAADEAQAAYDEAKAAAFANIKEKTDEIYALAAAEGADFDALVSEYSTDSMPAEGYAQPIPDSLLFDTCINLQWPLLSQYDDDTKATILNMAIGSAQNAKDNVAFNKLDLGSQTENINKHRKEWHKKFTLSIACLIFFFIGAPLGSIIRKGGLGLPVVISVVFFIIYHLISTIAERMAVFGDLNMFLGVWLSSLVLLPVGLFFTFKATTDAALFDGDSWKKFFQRMFKKTPT